MTLREEIANFWWVDCENAAIAGSSSARGDAIEFCALKCLEKDLPNPVESATRFIDDAIANGRHQEDDSSSSRSLKWSELVKWLRRIGIVLAAIFGGGAAAAGQKKE